MFSTDVAWQNTVVGYFGCEALSLKSGSKERKQNKRETKLPMEKKKKVKTFWCEQQERVNEGPRKIRSS